MVSWVGEAGRGYHCESDLAGLRVTVPLCFRSELFLKQNITRQCLEEMKSAQNLNLPVSHCIGRFHNKALVFHGRYPRSRRAQGTRKGPGSRVGVSGRHPQRCWGSLQAELSQFGAFPPYPRTAGTWTFFGETGRWTNNKQQQNLSSSFRKNVQTDTGWLERSCSRGCLGLGALGTPSSTREASKSHFRVVYTCSLVGPQSQVLYQRKSWWQDPSLFFPASTSCLCPAN